MVDLRGRVSLAPPGSKFFQFHAVFGKFWQNRMLSPPGGLAPSPWGNPGSATVIRHIHPDGTPYTSSYREDLEKVSQLPDLIGTNAASKEQGNKGDRLQKVLD